MASESSANRQQRQRQLLEQLARQIPVLIQAIARGDSPESSMIVAHKHLPDGRLVEITLRAKVMKPRDVGASYNELPLGI